MNRPNRRRRVGNYLCLLLYVGLMPVSGTLGLLVVAGAASLFMAWAIGAGSSGSTPFAPAVGANAISVMRAGFYVGILGLLGAVMQGANVTEAVGEELIGGVALSPTAAIVALATAAVLVAIGVFTAAASPTPRPAFSGPNASPSGSRCRCSPA